jgi:hypothetical protein
MSPWLCSPRHVSSAAELQKAFGADARLPPPGLTLHRGSLANVFPFLHLDLRFTVWLYLTLCRVESCRKSTSIDWLVTMTYHLASAVFVHLFVVQVE